MRTWVMKTTQNVGTWPRDMICVELDEERLLFIHEDGQFDISNKHSGLPSPAYWHLFHAEGD